MILENECIFVNKTRCNDVKNYTSNVQVKRFNLFSYIGVTSLRIFYIKFIGELDG